MFWNRIEQRNREVWEGHSKSLQDFTHVLGGVGLGLLLFPALQRQSKVLGYSLLLVSTALHFYADTVKPSRSKRRARLRRSAEPVEIY